MRNVSGDLGDSDSGVSSSKSCMMGSPMLHMVYMSLFIVKFNDALRLASVSVNA